MKYIKKQCFQYIKRPKPLSYEVFQEESVIEAESTEDHYVDIDLQNALDVLQDKDRIVIILKYFEEWNKAKT